MLRVKIFFAVVFLGFGCQYALAQNSNSYSAQGFGFKHLNNWKLSVTSSGNLQQYRLHSPGGKGVIIISSPNVEVSSSNDFDQVRQQISELFFNKIAAKFLDGGTPKFEDRCLLLNDAIVPGQRLTGTYDKVPTTAESYYFSSHKRFFSVIILVENSEIQSAESAEKLFAESLTVNGKIPNSDDLRINGLSLGVLNGKALKLPKPRQPYVKNPWHTTVDVRVRVQIDELGNVVSVKLDEGVSFEGGGEFVTAAFDAAKGAKFSPTLICGKPARVTGIIRYTFSR